MKTPTFNTLRAETWHVLDEADRKGVLLTSELAWGRLTREVTYATFCAELSKMIKAKHARKVRPPKGAFPRRCFVYVPGAQPLDGAERERLPKRMGFMEAKRLREARAAARRAGL
jgi:hypothetical protein